MYCILYFLCTIVGIDDVTVEPKYQTELVVRPEHVWSLARHLPVVMVTLFPWLRLRWGWSYFHTRNFPSRRPAQASTGRQLHSNCADTLQILCRYCVCVDILCRYFEYVDILCRYCADTRQILQVCR